MRKISIWGRNNPGKARIIIAVSHCILLVIAIALGLLGYVNDIRVSYGMMTGIILTFFILYLFYPIRKCRWIIFRHSYIRQKSHDLLLAFTTLLLFGGLTNQFAYEPLAKKAESPFVKPVVLSLGEKKDVQTSAFVRKSLRESVKVQVKSLKKQYREFKKANRENGSGNNKNALKIFLVLLILGAAVLALSGIGALSCSLSCSGNEGAAILVLLGGIGLLVFLVVASFRAIARIGVPKTSPREPEVEAGPIS